MNTSKISRKIDNTPSILEEKSNTVCQIIKCIHIGQFNLQFLAKICKIINDLITCLLFRKFFLVYFIKYLYFCFPCYV